MGLTLYESSIAVSRLSPDPLLESNWFLVEIGALVIVLVVYIFGG